MLQVLHTVLMPSVVPTLRQSPSSCYRFSTATRFFKAPRLAAATAADSATNKVTSPLPLSATHEQQVKEIYYKRVRGYCAPEIKGLHTLAHFSVIKDEITNLSSWKTAFAECARGRTFTTTWVCREQRLAMNSCMLAHARRREREEAEAAVEKRREEVIRMMKGDQEKNKR